MAASTLHGTVGEVDPKFVFAKRIDPFDHIPRLEERLTGRSFDLIVAEFSSVPPIALDEGGEGFVAAMSESMVSALASADQEQLNNVAVLWSQTEEFEERADPHELAGLLGDCRRTRGPGCSSCGSQK